MTPDLAPGFRYDQTAVMDAAEVIERGAGPYHYYKDDPRNIVQDVLDIFIDHGWLVAMDLGYEATIIDLRAQVKRLNEKLVHAVALSHQDLIHMEEAVRERDKACRALAHARAVYL